MENSKQLLQGSKGAYDANCHRKHLRMDRTTEGRKDINLQKLVCAQQA